MLLVFEIFIRFADLVTYNLFGIEEGTRLADSVHFFFYDTTKIIFLLSIMIFFISIIRSYFPPEKTKELLSNAHKLFYKNSFNAVSIAKTFQIEYKKVATFQGMLTKREYQLKEQFKKDGYDLGEW